MSHKNRDECNRWRNKTVAFRCRRRRISSWNLCKIVGVNQAGYITRRLLGREVIVQGNPRVFKACGSSWWLFGKNSGGSKPEKKWTRNCWKSSR